MFIEKNLPSHFKRTLEKKKKIYIRGINRKYFLKTTIRTKLNKRVESLRFEKKKKKKVKNKEIPSYKTHINIHCIHFFFKENLTRLLLMQFFHINEKPPKNQAQM